MQESPKLYDNFDIHIVAGQNGRYALFVTNPFGIELSETVWQTLPQGELFTDYVAYLRELIARTTDAEELGQMLHEFLFPASIQRLFERSKEIADQQGKKLRVRLHIQADQPELNLIPWEYCAGNKKFLALDISTPLIRYMPTSESLAPLRQTLPVTVLVVTADVTNTLNVSAELQHIRTALHPLIEKRQIILQVVTNATRQMLTAAVQKYQPHIFHFIGHGGVVEGQTGALMLVGENGRSDPVTANELMVLLTGGVKLAILNACQTIESPPDKPLMAAAQQLVWAGMPAVIGMQFKIPDKTSEIFSQILYQRLVEGQSLDAAVTKARIALYINHHDKVFWAIPVLFMRAPDGVLWRIPPPCPYRGLESFREEDKDLFFGRDDDIERIVKAIQDKKQAVTVSGASGSGKSSVVFAGVLPRFQHKEGWKIVTMRPGQQPLKALNAALAQKPPVPARLLLVIDQFEELYTYTSEKQIHRQFLDQLLAVPDMTAILTLRIDFWEKASNYRAFAEVLEKGLITLWPVEREGMKQIIKRPAESQDVTYSENLIERILDGVAPDGQFSDPGDLLLLEFALTRLWKKQEEIEWTGQLTGEAYEASGQVHGALEQHADEVYKQLNHAEKQLFPHLLTQLILPREDIADTRRLVTSGELTREEWQLAQKLAEPDNRLVVIDWNQNLKKETAEIVHEALIQRWQQLKDWMRDKRNFRLWQEQVESVRKQWETSRNSADLLQGSLLIQSEEWLHKGFVKLHTQQHFIQASLDHQKHVAQRNRLLAIAFAFIALIALIAAGIAIDQRGAAVAESTRAAQNLATATIAQGAEIIARQTAVAESTRAAQSLATATMAQGAEIVARQTAQAESTRADQNLATATVAQGEALSSEATAIYNAQLAADAQATAEYNAQLAATREAEAITQSQIAQSQVFAISSLAVQDEDPMLGLLLAIMSGQAADTIQAFNRIYDSLLLKAPPRITLQHAGGLNGAMWSDDDSQILTWDENGKARVWDSETGIEQLELSHQGWAYGIVWNKDKSQVLTWGGEGKAIIWDGTTGEEVQSFEHDDSILGATWDDDESLVLTWGADGKAIIWNVFTGKEIHILEHQGEVLGAIWNGGESQVLTWSDDGNARIWDGVTGDELHKLEHDNEVLGAMWNDDWSLVLTWGKDKTARIWNVETGEERRRFTHEDWVMGAIWNKDENLVLTWSRDNRVRVWSVETEDEQLQFPHEGTVRGATWNEDESQILSWSMDKTARVWDVALAVELLKFIHEDVVEGAAWNQDESLILTWSWDGTAKIWNAVTGKERFRLIHELEIWSAAWSRDGHQVLTASQDGTVRVWDTLQAWENGVELSWEGSVNGAQWNKDESQVLIWSEDGTVRIWDTETWNEKFKVSHGVGGVFDGYVYGAIWNESESHVLSWSADETARIWDTATEAELHKFEHGDLVQGAVWNQNESQILTWGRNGLVKLWDVETETEQMTFRHEIWVKGAIWNEDESKVMTWGCDEKNEIGYCTLSTVKIWDAVTGEEQSKFTHNDKVTGAMWNGDETYVLIWGCDITNPNGFCIEGAARIWDVETGEEELISYGNGEVNGAAWNRDESQILIWGCAQRHEDNFIDCTQGIVSIWNIATEEYIGELSYDGEIVGAAWNGNEKLVLIWSEDGTIKVWNIEKENLLMDLDVEGKLALVVQSSHDEQRILFVTMDGFLRILSTEMKDLLAVACEYATRNFTWQEWQVYFPGQPYRRTCEQWPIHPTVPEAEIAP